VCVLMAAVVSSQEVVLSCQGVAASCRVGASPLVPLDQAAFPLVGPWVGACRGAGPSYLDPCRGPYLGAGPRGPWGAVLHGQGGTGLARRRWWRRPPPHRLYRDPEASSPVDWVLPLL